MDQARPPDRRPKVAVVAHGYFPRVGGSERYHQVTARALAEVADVEVFTAGARPGLGTRAEHRTVEGRTVHYLPWVPVLGDRLVPPPVLWRALRRFDPDLVWAGHPSLTADIAGAYALVRGRPWVVTFHADVLADRLLPRAYRTFEAALLRRAAAVLVQTEHYASVLARRGIPARRLTVVPLGPLIGQGHPQGPFDSGIGPSTRPGRDHPFLFVSALDAHHAYKGLERLIDAVAHLAREGTRVELAVAGEGPWRIRYEDRVRDRGVSDRVRFLGRIDDLELSEQYRASWALVLPAMTDTEGFGAVAVEAAWYGCPSVVSSAAAAAEFWRRNGGARVYDAEEVAGLERALAAVWMDSRERQRLSAEAATTRSVLDWSELLPRVLAPVRALLRRRGANDEAVRA